ncbi:MAG: flippase-like domain-containing protein [Chloroflexaceae bacterium]|nr:flippase-like domain-containing protein [Chloroflexaceae bacterium]
MDQSHPIAPEHADNLINEPDQRNDETIDQEHIEREGFSLWERLRNPRTLISFGIALAIVVFVFRGLNINPEQTWEHIQNANLWWLLVGFLVFYCTFPLRAIRWRILLVNAHVPVYAGRKTWSSLPALIEYIYLSWFANCIVPAKLGDAYRGYLLKHNGQVSFSSTFGTIFAERLLDMLGLFGILVLSAAITFGDHLPDGTQIVFGFGALLVVMIIAGLTSMRLFSPLIHKMIPMRLHGMYERFEQAALRSFRPVILPQLIFFTTLVWLLEGFRLFFVIKALEAEGLSLPLSAIIFVALASSLLTALPITPAGLGVVEGTITVVLAFFAVPTDLGVAVTLLDRLINFWSIVVFGFVVYLFSKRR